MISVKALSNKLVILLSRNECDATAMELLSTMEMKAMQLTANSIPVASESFSQHSNEANDMVIASELT